MFYIVRQMFSFYTCKGTYTLWAGKRIFPKRGWENPYCWFSAFCACWFSSATVVLTLRSKLLRRRCSLMALVSSTTPYTIIAQPITNSGADAIDDGETIATMPISRVSAGIMYDKIGGKAKGKIVFVTDGGVICKVISDGKDKPVMIEEDKVKDENL